MVNDIVRKRGFLKKGEQRLAITDNNLIEELLGQFNIICIEDIIEGFLKCENIDSHFEEIKKVIWPI